MKWAVETLGLDGTVESDKGPKMQQSSQDEVKTHRVMKNICVDFYINLYLLDICENRLIFSAKIKLTCLLRYFDLK